MIKKIFNGILWGAGVTLGSVIVTKGTEVVQDPVRKAKIKNKFNKIKEAIKE